MTHNTEATTVGRTTVPGLAPNRLIDAATGTIIAIRAY